MEIWQSRFSALDLKMNINVSARQIQQSDVVADMRQAMDTHGLSGDSLSIEITESLFMENTQSSFILNGAKVNLGIQISVDDFGTGYYSLSYLKNLPIDNLKIDKSFVSQLAKNHVDASIVQAIISLAHCLDLTVTAEGVESAEELSMLYAMGCERGQGYLFGKPMPPEAIELLLAAQSRMAEAGLDISEWGAAIRWPAPPLLARPPDFLAAPHADS